MPLIQDRLIDFIRVHISDIGGLTPARKLAALCEFFGVRTAWHGPGDVSPVGHAANLQLDLACSNFGIQEAHLFGERTREVFPGSPEIRDGAMWSNDRPGLGIDIDEALAARYPFPEHPLNGAWPPVRLRTARCSGHESAQQNADKFRACARASSAFACRPLSELLPSAFGVQ